VETELTYRFDQIAQAADWLLHQAADRRCLVFHGDLGAGKTTLIAQLCRLLGVTDAVSSPTFSLINEYARAQGGAVYHIDLYRLRDEKEAMMAGVADCLDSGRFCLLEWPSRAPALIPDDALPVRLEILSEDTRRIRLFQ